MCRGKIIFGNNTTPSGNKGIVVTVAIESTPNGSKPVQTAINVIPTIITEKGGQENR